MIKRFAINYLNHWYLNDERKPLVLRGARQVGKTTLVQEFAKKYEVFLHLNLDKEDDLQLFENHHDVEALVMAIHRHCRKKVTNGKTLLFIDEIQNSSKAVAILRYLYEEKGDLHVIAAGSMLESLIDKNISFPVGRVEYLAIRPCSFIEFLDGIGENFDADLINNIEAESVHSRIMNLFYEYVLVGGMPEVIKKYADKRDVLVLDRIYDSLLNSYMDDVQKYARNNNLEQIIRFIIEKSWSYAASRITFERFGNSNYKSREVGESFRTLERTMILEMVYPISEPHLPMITSVTRKPKLLMLDTGLVNYFAGVRELMYSTTDFTDAWRGLIAEHIVGQELLASRWEVSAHRYFWERAKNQSSAEIDYVIKYKGWIIPIEVKSGHNSKLKSLHIFMEHVQHNVAVRVWSQNFSIDNVKTQSGKDFRLFNIPFYYVGVLSKVLDRYL